MLPCFVPGAIGRPFVEYLRARVDGSMMFFALKSTYGVLKTALVIEGSELTPAMLCVDPFPDAHEIVGIASASPRIVCMPSSSRLPPQAPGP